MSETFSFSFYDPHNFGITTCFHGFVFPDGNFLVKQKHNESELFESSSLHSGPLPSFLPGLDFFLISFNFKNIHFHEL